MMRKCRDENDRRRSIDRGSPLACLLRLKGTGHAAAAATHVFSFHVAEKQVYIYPQLKDLFSFEAKPEETTAFALTCSFHALAFFDSSLNLV